MCDIEGSELEMIRAEIDTLRSRVEVFIVEFHPGISGLEPVEEVRLFLKDHGFAEEWHRHNVFVYQNSTLS